MRGWMLGLGLVCVRGGAARPVGVRSAAVKYTLALALTSVITQPAVAHAHPGTPPDDFGAQNTTHVLIIAGLGGEPAYSQAFLGYGKLLKQAALDRYGVQPANITLLAEKADADPLVDGR